MGVFLWENNEKYDGIPITKSDVVVQKCIFDNNEGGNVCFDPNYSMKMDFKVKIDGKAFVIGPKNYEKYRIKNDYIVH